MAKETKERRFEYSREYFEELEKMIATGNETEIFEFVKGASLSGWNSEDFFPRLYDYNLDAIFNGLFYSCLCSSQERLNMIEKYEFNIYQESHERIKKAQLDCGLLSIEEVYDYASNKKSYITDEALKGCEWTPEWVDKFIALNDYFLSHSLLQHVDMTFEQFVTLLDADKKRDEEQEREWEEKYNEGKKRQPREDMPTHNSYARNYIKNHYPFNSEQEEIIKKYCEYELFMESMRVEPTYEKVVHALSNQFYCTNAHSEIGRTIKVLALTEEQQLKILEIATSTDMLRHYLRDIVSGLLGNENITAETVIAMCVFSNIQEDGMLFSLFGYGDNDKSIIDFIRKMELTDEQKAKLKKATIYTAFDGAAQREDFTFEDCLEMLSNEKCNFTSEGIERVIDRFVAVTDGDRWSRNRTWNNENELRLAQKGSWVTTHTLLQYNNPNSLAETIIEFAKTPLNCGPDRNWRSGRLDQVYMEKVKNTVLTDEQFDLLLEIANTITIPENADLLRDIEARKEKDYDYGKFIKTIEDGKFNEFCRARDNYDDQMNWAATVNGGLIAQRDLSFERLIKILETAKSSQTKIAGNGFDRAIYTRAFTTQELEKLIELGITSLKGKLEEQVANPNVTPTPMRLAVIDFATQTVELPKNAKGEDISFYVVDVKEGRVDNNGNPLTTRRVFVPMLCKGVEFRDETTVSFYPADRHYDERAYIYSIGADSLTHYDYDEYMHIELPDTVTSINTSLIADINSEFGEQGQARVLKPKGKK